MTPFRNISVAIRREDLRRETLRTLAAFSPVPSWNEIDPSDWSQLTSQLEAVPADILLLDLASMQNDELAGAVQSLHARVPQTRIVALHTEADSATILNAMRAGVSEFVYSPLSESLEPALERLALHTANPTGEKRQGKLVAFLSAKGGCGATTLACHVAAELRRQTKSEVLLADFDFTSGVVSFLMKAKSSYSVLDAVRNISRLDESLWKAFVGVSPSGLSILPAPAAIAHGDYPDESEFRQVLRFMRSQHEWTVIDLGRSLTRTARAVLEEVDELFLISTLEVMALHGTKAIAQGVSASNVHKLHLVLNRVPKMMDISVDELTTILGRPIYATLPNDYPSLYQSYAAGTLLPANSRLAEHFSKFAARLAGTEEPKKAKKRFSLF